MTFVDLLTADLPIGGIKAPAFCWVSGATIVLFTLECGRRLSAKVGSQCTTQDDVRTKIQRASDDATPTKAGEGLTGQAFEQIAQAFDGAEALKRAWRNFRKLVLIDPSRSGEDRLYASDSAEVAFSEQAVVTPELNLDFYRSVPGIITGFGLLVTFVAILVALLGVNYDKDRVTGLSTLIRARIYLTHQGGRGNVLPEGRL
jgi:hypothetical protein